MPEITRHDSLKGSPSSGEGFPSSGERRSFLSWFNAGATSLAAIAFGGVALAQVKPAAPKGFEPARHDKDDWMDAIPGKHRLVFDATSEEGARNALLFAGNFMVANRSDYGLQNRDLAVIVVFRHLATQYGFNNEMWTKYGASFAGGPPAASVQSTEAPKANPSATSLVSLANQGIQFAVCAMATGRLAGQAARQGGNADAVFTEFGANLVANARLVPAGIVAVNRAQERGYSVVAA